VSFSGFFESLRSELEAEKKSNVDIVIVCPPSVSVSSLVRLLFRFLFTLAFIFSEQLAEKFSDKFFRRIPHFFNERKRRHFSAGSVILSLSPLSGVETDELTVFDRSVPT
jgi:hypothetical protein